MGAARPSSQRELRHREGNLSASAPSRGLISSLLFPSLVMASLAPPPPPNRHRASSTNVRPPLTLTSLGSRRRSNSLLALPPPVASPLETPPLTPSEKDIRYSLPMPALPPSPAPKASPSRIESFVSRCLQLLPINQKHDDLSTPSSPRLSRASTDSTILPLSASPTRTTFADAFPEQQLLQPRKAFLRGPPSVRALTSRVSNTHRVTFPDTHTCTLCAHALPAVYCTCCLLHVYPPHHHAVAAESLRPRRIGA